MEIIFCDIETSGLNPFVNQITEAAFVPLDHAAEPLHFSLPLRDNYYEDKALSVQKYAQRQLDLTSIMVDPDLAAARIEILFRDSEPRMLGVNNASFDVKFLEHLLWKTRGLSHGPWHYQVADVKAMAAGYFHEPLPLKTSRIEELTGIKADDFEGRHTALGDALWDRAVYEFMAENGDAALAVRGDEQERLREAAQEAGAIIEDLLAMMGPRGEKYGLPRQKAAERFLGKLRAALAVSPVRSDETPAIRKAPNPMRSPAAEALRESMGNCKGVQWSPVRSGDTVEGDDSAD